MVKMNMVQALNLALDEEMSRVLPVIEALAKRVAVPISIDSYKSEVARRAIAAGACMVNDISAGNFDPEMKRIVAETGAATVLMHIKGKPRDMQKNPTDYGVLRDHFLNRIILHQVFFLLGARLVQVLDSLV